jgi:multisubunit Na+/H+ antiporter MnhB subunit
MDGHMKETTRIHLIDWGIVVVLWIAVFSLFLFPAGNYSSVGFSNACFGAGMIILLFLAFNFLIRSGVFDILGYAGVRFVESWRPNPTKRWDTAYDYKLYKKEKREKHPLDWLPNLVIGGSSLLLAVLFLIINNARVGW